MVRTSIRPAAPRPRHWRCRSGVDQQYALVGVRNAFAQQILAGDAEMHHAARQLRSDSLAENGDLDIVEAGNPAVVAAPRGKATRALRA
jgi:hypothetical protein